MTGTNAPGVVVDGSEARWTKPGYTVKEGVGVGVEFSNKNKAALPHLFQDTNGRKGEN